MNKIQTSGKIVFFIHKKKVETDQEVLTARQILQEYAEESTDHAYLVLNNKGSNGTVKYTNPDEAIQMENGMQFIVMFTDPTTVS